MSERKLAHIETIEWLQPIEGKDRIVLAGVLGWTVIVQKSDFNVGDKVVFCEIDSVFPNDRPEFAFLEKKCNISRFITRKGTNHEEDCMRPPGLV